MPSLGDVAAALGVGIGDAVLAPVRPGSGPATERWGVGVGEFAASRVPGPLRGIARRLNRFGSVAVSPDSIEFDGDAVDWSAVSEIRTRRLVGYLMTGAITRQVDKVPLWRFPGRGLVVDGLSRAALTTVVVLADLRLDSGVFTLYIPAEVHYRGLVRRKDMAAGVPAALVLADPAVRDLVETTAAAHGVPVLMADDDALDLAARRAASIRATVGRAVRLVGALAGQAGTRSSA